MSNTIKIASVRGNATTVLGTANIAVPNPESRFCVQILVKANTADTTFDISLIDIYGNTIYEMLDNTGVHNAFVHIPATQFGNWTLSVTNASADEAFTYLCLFQEA